MIAQPTDDPGDGGTGGGGSGGGSTGGGTLYTRKWLDIHWTFPSNAPPPEGFDVVAFEGTNPDDTTKYIFPPLRVLATDRRLVKSFFPRDNMPTINAAVRAVYAN